MNGFVLVKYFKRMHTSQKLTNWSRKKHELQNIQAKRQILKTKGNEYIYKLYKNLKSAFSIHLISVIKSSSSIG